jgi:hypothetical protein
MNLWATLRAKIVQRSKIRRRRRQKRFTTTLRFPRQPERARIARNLIPQPRPQTLPPPQNDASTSSGATEGHPGDTTSVFDRPKKRHDRSDFFIVPASTEIRVSVEHRDGAPPSSAVEIGKVVLPVRIGFADAIPVFSKVTFGPVGIGTFSVLDYRDNFGLLYELTTVTVGKKTYKIHTDALPYSPEMRFTLAKPLWIKR